MTFFRFPYGVYSGMLPLLCKATSKVYHWLHIHITHLVIYIDRSPFAPSPEFEPLCSQFDGSENFLVNCSQSTFCMTRTYRLKLRKGCRTLSNIKFLSLVVQEVRMWSSEREAAPSRSTVTRVWTGASGGQWPLWWRRHTPVGVSRTGSGRASWPLTPSGATVIRTGTHSAGGKRSPWLIILIG